MRKQEWANPAESNVVGSDGVVHFWGTVGSQEERTALRVVAENIRCPRDRGSHDLRAPVFIAALPGDLNQQRGDRSCLAMPGDQRDVIIFLSKASSYGTAVEPVEIIQTHVSLVFLAGDCAHKLKRAMKFLYLDFSTVEQRRVACEAGLALNRRTAPKLYLEVRALTRAADGWSALGLRVLW